MPGRNFSLETGQIYHVMNRGITDVDIFNMPKQYQRAMSLIGYYQYLNPPVRFSYFQRLPPDVQVGHINRQMKNNRKMVSIMAFCLMPNHFHFLLRQLTDKGISIYLSKFSNSFTRYLNVKYKRSGPILQGRFKAVLIESSEQLLHVSRYIHLNPYSAGLVSDFVGLEEYPYSSYREYLAPYHPGLCNVREVMNIFSNSAGFSYRDFIRDHADYQRRLQFIKHLALDI